jgi:hypothetical protein
MKSVLTFLKASHERRYERRRAYARSVKTCLNKNAPDV